MINKPLKRRHLLQALGAAPVSDEQLKPPAETASESMKRPRARILLVEDVEVNRKVVQGMLRGADCDVDITENGREALEAVRQRPYDLVFMDIQMPEMDGLTATRLIREDERFKDLPIVAMSAHAFKEDQDRSFAAGMNGYLTKPIEREALLECVEQWRPKTSETSEEAGTSHSSEALPSAPDARPAPSAEDEASSCPVNEPEALDRVGGDMELLLELLAMFDDAIAETLPALERAVEVADAEETRAMSHRLKGSSANLSVNDLRDAAAELEIAAKAADLDAMTRLLPRVQSETQRFKAYWSTRRPTP